MRTRSVTGLAALLLMTGGCNDSDLVKPAVEPEPVPPAQIEVTPSSLEFGITLIGDTPTQTITIANVAAPGSADLRINSVVPELDAHFQVGAVPAFPLVLAPQQSVTVPVAYAPDLHLEENAGRIVVDYVGGVAPVEVSADGQGLLCESLSVLKLQDEILPVSTSELIATYGIDGEFDLFYDPNFIGAVRFASQKIGCVWVEEGASFVGIAGSQDTQAPWGVDNAVVIEFLDLQENRLGWAYGGDGYLDGLRYIPTSEMLPILATATVPGGQVGVNANPTGLYGFPSRGAGSFDLLPYFTPLEPVIFRLNTLDEGSVGSVTDLYLFADYGS